MRSSGFYVETVLPVVLTTRRRKMEDGEREEAQSWQLGEF